MPVAYPLAVIGALFLAWEASTIIPWLADGPSQLTQFRDPDLGTINRFRIAEAIMIVISIAVLVYLVRSCVRERRLVFDAQFCIAGALLFWLDPMVNFYLPVVTWSSNFVNLQNWCGQAPGVVNPDCSSQPEPMIFLGLLYTFGMLVFAVLVGSFMRLVKARRPGISLPRLLGATFVAAVALDIAFEGPMVLMRFWSHVGAGPDALSIFGDGQPKFPIPIILVMGLWFTFFAALRFFKDDNGETVVERGLSRIPRPRRTLITLLALVGIFQGATLAADAGWMALGPYADPYPRAPAHIVNDLCDAPGFASDTRYGPCPGSEGFRAPIRNLDGPP